MVKIGKKKLMLHSGKVVTFKSSASRARYERVAQAIKHGWKPTGKTTQKSGGKKKAVKKSSGK
jgi:hypothetical protein